MANILTIDDATFAAGQGNWTGAFSTTLSTENTPTFSLQGSPPEGVGGWGVGMVRMGAN